MERERVLPPIDENTQKHESALLDAEPVYVSNESRLAKAKRDFQEGLSKHAMWRSLAWGDFQMRYRRSYFGILWAIFSYIAFTLAIIFFFSALTGGGSRDDTLYLLFGFLIFTVISGALVDACSVFMGATQWLYYMKIPYSVFVFKGVATHVIVFVFNVIAVVIMLAFVGYSPSPLAVLWSLLGFVFVVLNAVWVFFFFGVFASRYKDISQVIAAAMRMAVFLTPIFWVPGDEGLRSYVALFNPLTHYVEIFRSPLMDGSVPFDSWMIVLALTLVGYILAAINFVVWRDRLIYWI